MHNHQSSSRQELVCLPAAMPMLKVEFSVAPSCRGSTHMLPPGGGVQKRIRNSAAHEHCSAAATAAYIRQLGYGSYMCCLRDVKHFSCIKNT